jgi:hypothetical protein
MVRVGIHGVNFHTFPRAGYEPFRISQSNGVWQADVAPEYYGLLMFVRAAPAGSRLLPVSGARDATLHLWATQTPDGTLRVLAVNTGTGARAVHVAVAGPPTVDAVLPVGDAQLQFLTAPSLSSSDGVTLAGQTFGSRTLTGLLGGEAQTPTASPVDGRYEVWVPAGSAALLALAP